MMLLESARTSSPLMLELLMATMGRKPTSETARGGIRARCSTPPSARSVRTPNRSSESHTARMKLAVTRSPCETPDAAQRFSSSGSKGSRPQACRKHGKALGQLGHPLAWFLVHAPPSSSGRFQPSTNRSTASGLGVMPSWSPRSRSSPHHSMSTLGSPLTMPYERAP